MEVLRTFLLPSTQRREAQTIRTARVRVLACVRVRVHLAVPGRDQERESRHTITSYDESTR